MQVNSRIDQKIEDIYAFIESCKMQAFSNVNVIVPKEELYDLLDDLRNDVPDEIQRYQKMLNRRNEILNDAEQKAQALIVDANEQFKAVLSEHNIVQSAYAEAEEILTKANEEAQKTLDDANAQADDIVKGALYYSGDMLSKTEDVIAKAFDSVSNNARALEVAMKGHLDIISKDRAELMESLETGPDISVPAEEFEEKNEAAKPETRGLKE